jgi:hypothetical protein
VTMYLVVAMPKLKSDKSHVSVKLQLIGAIELVPHVYLFLALTPMTSEEVQARYVAISGNPEEIVIVTEFNRCIVTGMPEDTRFPARDEDAA